MKLALIVPGGVDRSGVDRIIPCNLWLIERLACRHEVHVFAMNQEPLADDWELGGSLVHNIGTTPGRRRRLVAKFAAIHRARPFDLVHAFFGGCGAAAAYLGWRHGIPVIVHASGGEFVGLGEIGYGMRCTLRGRLAMRFATAGADRITVATPYMQALAAARGVHAKRVPLGVALDVWPLSPPRARDFARPARLLHVADIRPVKDQLTLLTAAGRLRDAGLDFLLDMVGFDTLDGDVQNSEAARRLSPIIRWHGVLRREPLRELMTAADLLLVSSKHEAGPIVVLEAAVAGVPTVGTAVGHVAEFAPDAAVAVPIGDAEALARATAMLLANENRRLALAREAQRRAAALDSDATARAFEGLYAELVAERD